MKELVRAPIGGDGGAIVVNVTELDLILAVAYPKAKVLEPIKKNFIDKLKAIIPGTWDDILIDKAWEDALKGL